jgi:hypothetical protein
MDKELSKLVQIMFADLNSQRAASSFPAPGSLSDLLSRYVDPLSKTNAVPATRTIRTSFATAAVEMWHRAVHSFLISASLTEASPIWASVAGYYSSHYSIRAFAHLFGVFQLFRAKRIAHLDSGGGHVILEKKDANDREHKFYWKFVDAHPQLAKDPFFYVNREDQVDGGHRNKANYWDHICRYPAFRPLDTQFLSDRVERIASIEFSDVPVPSTDRFPDIDNVQIVAYHRLVKFRQLVDEALGDANRFWNVHRNPPWRPDSMKFSVVEPVFAALYANYR